MRQTNKHHTWLEEMKLGMMVLRGDKETINIKEFISFSIVDTDVLVFFASLVLG